VLAAVSAASTVTATGVPPLMVTLKVTSPASTPSAGAAEVAVSERVIMSVVADWDVPKPKALPPGAKFCDGCGHDLRGSKRAPTPDYTEPTSYTPKHLTEKILTTRSAMEGERKLVTVLFADVANFTSLSEKLDPEEVHQIMDGCFRILMDEIHRHEGTINQFTGDGVMALFGAPVAHEDHAQRACHAALSIQKAMDEYGRKIEEDTGVEFKMRVGINSGPVIVGAIGDDLRMDYTAQGHTVGLAQRIEQLAEPGRAYLTQHTARLVEGSPPHRARARLRVH